MQPALQRCGAHVTGIGVTGAKRTRYQDKDGNASKVWVVKRTLLHLCFVYNIQFGIYLSTGLFLGCSSKIVCMSA